MPTPTTLVSDEEFREMFAISKDVKSGLLARHLGAASRRLRAWVGKAAYRDALKDSDWDDEARHYDLELAEATLAMHFAIIALNTQITPKGVVKTAKVDANTVNSYLIPREISELSQMYLDQAEEIARPYMQLDGTPAAEFGSLSAL